MLKIDDYPKFAFQKYLDIFTKRSATAICMSLWIFSLLVQIPTHLGWGDYKYVSHKMLYLHCGIWGCTDCHLLTTGILVFFRFEHSSW